MPQAIFSCVNHVDLFPGSKRAEIEIRTDEGRETYERLERVWEAIFEGAVAKFKTCSYVRFMYSGKGVCTWDPKNKKLECSWDSTK